MTDFYSVLGVQPSATAEEIVSASEELLGVRKARRQRTGDIHAAVAVLGDPTLRRAFDVARFGQATGARLVRTKDTAVVVAGQVVEMVPDIDLQELARSTWQAALRAVVLTTGATAKVADVTAFVSRKVQSEAAKRIVS